jgi:CHAD domain-containing protein
MAAFSIRPNRAPAKRLRRVGSGRAKRAASALDEAGGDPEEAVHTARRRIKEARAVLRLSRAFVGEAEYRYFNRSLRAIARPLSEARDTTALLATLEQLSPAKGASLEGLRARLLEDRRVQYQRLSPTRPQLAERARQLARAMARLPLPSKKREREWKMLATSLAASYRAGRRALSRAQNQPSFENRHQLRKRSKDLRYQFEVLRPLSSKEIEQVEEAAHRLTDLLGEDHDLAVLSGRLDSGWAEGEDVSQLSRDIEERRAALWGEALPLAERIYAERPKVFIRGIKSEFARAVR